MKFSDYKKLDDLHVLSAEDTQSLNADLATKTRSEIPDRDKERVADYLVAALNMESVEPKFVLKLQKLLRELQE